MRIQVIPLFWLVIMTVWTSGLHGQTSSAGQFPEIRIRISNNQFNTLLRSKGEKTVLKNPVMTIGKDTAKVKEVHSRGNNSLTFEHKSLAVDLENAVAIYYYGKKVKIKKFDLMNLVMDKNLWHDRWAFLTMAELNIFPLFSTYCTVWINDQPQGIYLLVEKPRHFTTTEVKSPYMIRRGVNHVIDGEYVDTPDKEQSKKYKKQYLTLYQESSKRKGEDLYNFLQGALNLDHYFEWLAFNYLTMNGDYADELYLYILPATGQFDIIPWDYDDILRPTPHEGAQSRNANPSLKNKLIFSGEDPLDRAIAGDEYVYEKYKSAFRKMLLALPPETLTRIADRVNDELRLLNEDGMSARASLFLGKEPFQLEQAKEDIRRSLDFIVARRNALLKDLN
jgi:hypothetical protein